MSLPSGDAGGEEKLGDYIAWQVPIGLEVGDKLLPSLFLGVYATYGRGPVARAFEDAKCRQLDCSAESVHAGAEIQYHLRPGRWVNPWLGYGLGFESVWNDGYPSTTLRGVELARLMLGADIRVSRTIGFGPFVDVALGGYVEEKTVQDRRGPAGTPSVHYDTHLPMIVHAWTTIGMRVVVFP